MTVLPVRQNYSPTCLATTTAMHVQACPSSFLGLQSYLSSHSYPLSSPAVTAVLPLQLCHVSYVLDSQDYRPACPVISPVFLAQPVQQSSLSSNAMPAISCPGWTTVLPVQPCLQSFLFNQDHRLTSWIVFSAPCSLVLYTLTYFLLSRTLTNLWNQIDS